MAVVKDKTKQLYDALNTLVQDQVLVGIPSSKTQRETGDPLTNAQIGYIQEHGAPELNIPARPFLIPGVESAEPKYVPYLKQAAEAALQGREELVTRRLDAAGIVAASAVKVLINSNIPPALAPSTLAARKRRGITRENTLIDTGQLRNAVTYVLRERKK